MLRLLLLALLAAPAVAASKPNVIVILTDDQGWGDLSLHGNTNLKTPNIDGLAKSGAQFERFFVQPVCSPTRAEFLTGRYHPRGGVVGVSEGGERLDLGVKTIADSFRAAGYATACYGKWHNGSQYPYHPNGRGFDDFYGFTSGHWGHYFSPPLEHNGKDVRGDGFIADDLTNKAIEFAKAKREKPFFCLLTYNTPHSPMQVPDDYWNRFKGADLKLRGEGKENLDHTRAALAMVENLDANIGRLLKSLDERNTIVVYFHDNGPNGRRWNGGMKGIKGNTDEGGVRSPLVIRWTGKIQESMVKPIAGAIDLLPTLAELCEVPHVGKAPLDGLSFAQGLRGGAMPKTDRMIYAMWNGRVSARSQTHRLDAAGKLYDMVNDPHQTKPVDNALLNGHMLNAAQAWRTEMLGTLQKLGREESFPVGWREMPRTVLPARDGVPNGGVKRSAGAPNCSYFTNWTSTRDSMTWHVEVETAGTYEAILHYTSAEAGSAIELTLGDAAWKQTIGKVHDPKPYGPAHDRVSRGSESDMKEFAPLHLGTASLAKGCGTLTLKAATVAGKSAAEVWAVELILKP